MKAIFHPRHAESRRLLCSFRMPGRAVSKTRQVRLPDIGDCILLPGVGILSISGQ
ncbi:MAG: hypothetical protein HPY85_16715 [Anaerolineae bacterium]|nr:hypothetical protein [Anaerolineae bacterium]